MSKRAIIWLKVLNHEENFWMGLLDDADETLSDERNGVVGAIALVDDYDLSDHQFIRVTKTLVKDPVTIFIPRHHIAAIVEVANEVNPLGFVAHLKNRH